MVSKHGGRLWLGGARNCEMFADLVVIADPEIATFPFEVFVKGVGAKYDGSTDFIAVSESCPALDVNVRIENTVASEHYILLDDAEFSDHTTGANDRIWVDSGGGGHTRPRVYGHK